MLLYLINIASNTVARNSGEGLTGNKTRTFIAMRLAHLFGFLAMYIEMDVYYIEQI